MSDQVARESARGSLILFIGNMLSTVLSAVATILVARLLGPAGYGLYTLVFVIPYTLQTFVGFGISFSATRYSSYYLSKGNPAKAVQITRSAVASLLLFGICLTVVNYFAGPYLAGLLLKRTGLSSYVQVASLAIIGQAVAQAATSALVGWNSMGGFSVSYVMLGLVRLVASPLLILVGFGVWGAVFGQVLGSLAFGAVAALATAVAMRRVGRYDWLGTFSHLREMLSYGFPLFLGGIASGLSGQYLNVILAIVASNTVVGFYQAGLNVTVAVSLISGALGNALYRSFATLDGLGGDLKSAFSYAMQYVSFILTPVVFFLAASSNVLYGVLYGSSFASGSFLLTLLAFSNIPVAFGLTVIPSFLNGVGKAWLSMFTSLAGAITVVIAGPALAIYLGLGSEGIIFSLFASNVVVSALGVTVSVRYVKARLDFVPLVGILLASLLSWLCVSLLPQSVFAWAESLTLDIIVFAGVYFTAVPILRGVQRRDLVRLRSASHGMGLIGGLARALLAYEEWVLRITEGAGA